MSDGKGYLLVYSLFHTYAPLIQESSKIAGVDMFPTDYCFQLKSLHFLRGAGQGGEWGGGLSFLQRRLKSARAKALISGLAVLKLIAVLL